MTTTWMQRVGRWSYRVLCGVAFATAGCSAESTENQPDFAVPAATSVEALSTNEHCDTEPADLVWNGGGQVRTSARYTAHDSGGRCFGSYLIDLNNYDKKYTKGTRVTYGRVIPTNQADCEKTQVRAYIWKKNASGAATFLGNKTPHGRWVTDSVAGARCVVPNVILDESIPGFVPGASYRLALSARYDDTSGTQFHEIYAATEAPQFARSPFRQEQDMAIMVEELNSLGPTDVDPRIQAYFGKRGSTAAQMECRVMEIELSQMRISTVSLQQVGATSAQTTRRVNALNSLYQGYCVGSTAPAMTDIQARMLEYMEATLAIHTQIMIALGIEDGKAAEVMGAINRFDMSRIMAGCGTEPSEFHQYVRTGQLPVGMTGPNVLLRNCTGDASNIQTRLGMTGSAPSIQSSMKSCIVNAFDTPPLDEKPTACGDPRAEGGNPCLADCHAPNGSSTDDPCKTNPMSTACWTKIKNDTGFSDLADQAVQKDLVQEWLATSAYYEAVNKVSMTNEQIKELTLRAAQNGLLKAQRELEAWDLSAANSVSIDPATGKATYKGGASQNIERGIKVLAVQMAQDALTKVQLEQQVLPAAEQAAKDELKKLCANDPNRPECQKPNESDPQKMCPQIDLDGGPIWVNHMDGSRMTVADRIETCTCENMRRASFVTAAGIPQQWLCQTTDEKKRFDCETNPWGPDDGRPNPLLRPECVNAFQPASMARDILQAQLCDKVRCADDQVGVLVNGRCSCFTNPTPTELANACNYNGPAGALDCADGNLVCDLEGVRCGNPKSGRTPFGNNPLCLVPATTTQLGGDTVWGHTAANDYFSSLVSVNSVRRDSFQMKQGYRFIAGPENYRTTYDKIGTQLVVEMLQPSSLPADKGDLQAYCSNPEAGINNLFLGQLPLVAGNNTLSFPLDSRCWGNGSTLARFGFGVRTASNQTTRGAFLGFRMGGTLTANANPVKPCGTGDPDPRPDFVDLGLLNDLRTGILTRGTIDGVWLRDSLLGGTALRVPTVPVLELLE